MPTYDYECKNCHHTWEAFQSIKAPPTKKCPACGKAKAQRVIGPGAGIIFKGSGFYITDYRSESYKKAAAAESKTSEAGSSDKKTDSATPKVEAKTEPKPKQKKSEE